MSRLETSVLIHRPPQDVWSFITDVDRYATILWGEHGKLVSPGPLGLDSRLRLEDRTALNVVEFEPLRRFAVEGSSTRKTVRRGRFGLVLEPTSEGTRVAVSMDLEFGGFGRVLSPLVLTYWRLLLPDSAKELRRYVEAPALDSLRDGEERVAAPARHNELIAVDAGFVCWFGLLISNGPLFGLQTIWLLLIALGLGAWTLLRRLRYSRSRLRVTLGPWSRAVDLKELESIHWKENSVRAFAQGTIVLRDRSGHRVPVEVGRFKRGEEWGPLLLESAAASGAKVDHASREILEHEI